jgi:carbon storage regulator
MLVLSRKRCQSIRIGKDIEIIVTSLNKDRVKLGISAPNELKILRTELEGDDESCTKSA